MKEMHKASESEEAIALGSSERERATVAETPEGGKATVTETLEDKKAIPAEIADMTYVLVREFTTRSRWIIQWLAFIPLVAVSGAFLWTTDRAEKDVQREQLVDAALETLGWRTRL
jgi:hypothetical protein